MANRLEGDGSSRMIQLMRQYGHNVDTDIKLATVTSAPPSLKIKVDGMKIELDSEDLIIAEKLTARKTPITIRKGSGSITSSMTSDGYTAHTHDITDFGITDGEIEYSDALAKDDRVIVAVTNDDQTYIIIDKAVSY